ncbi:glycerol-3-phosphate dehydrogenase/oxidase [Salsuginibacillus kocurii]|uniref:glycerol-3-phosphate dehydrogenase/oxidase n=1 Tax=Salsuginibacillus kocurii TaxID=427078 RepID=UPI0003A0182A|nr:glycerol-3-phosphate dehydrogenase/oxidase [Salsuginibacillus kocurii]
MNEPLSAHSRKDRLASLEHHDLDLLVIGGGITGAGVALDASARGLTTGLVEMQDFAAGTSSRSTKLVHGGLRYLKQLELKLVAEVGRERAIVYENAPHVTNPEWMMLPLMENGNFSRASTSVGLKVYDTLAKVKKAERRYMLNRARTIEKESLIRTEGLKGSGVYVEYRTDDARLTIETVKKAAQLGAVPVNYAKVTDLIYKNEKVRGAYVQDQVSGETYSISARHVINAAGPWVDQIREKDGSNKGKQLHLTKGVHLVFSHKQFPLEQAVYFDVPDGRMIFAIPRNGKTYVGTTETVYHGELANPKATETDVEYLVDATRAMFPDLNIQTTDVESTWAGLRPLIYEEGKEASEISRKDEVFESSSGLLSIAGGKLTGYRKMAERVVNQVTHKMNLHAPCPTKDIQLSGGEVGGSTQFEAYIEDNVSTGERYGLTKEEATFVLKFYGSNAVHVFQAIDRYAALEVAKGLTKIEVGQVAYAVEQEMALSILDICSRRTSWLLFDLPSLKGKKEELLQFMAYLLEWEDERLQFEKTILDKEIRQATPHEPMKVNQETI